MPNFENLSERDRAVLRSIFDPSLAIGEAVMEDETLVDEEAGGNTYSITAESKKLSGIDKKIMQTYSKEGAAGESAECERGRKLRARAVRLAEDAAGRGEALRLLDEAVELAGATVAPEAAAARNDRAQLLRLLGRDDEAMADLDKALELTAGRRWRARAQALCQRGVLLRRRGQDGAAKRDFAEAAGLGSAFAKKQVAEMNPYAALCNQMLQQVMKGETHSGSTLGPANGNN